MGKEDRDRKKNWMEMVEEKKVISNCMNVIITLYNATSSTNFLFYMAKCLSLFC